jgi:hypothetical protein
VEMVLVRVAAALFDQRDVAGALDPRQHDVTLEGRSSPNLPGCCLVVT